MSLVLTRPICEDQLFVATNELLKAIGLPLISNMYSLNSDLLIKIFETIYGRKTKKGREDSKESKIEACQTILNILCDEILLIPLTHISAEGLVSRCVEDIGNLVEILSTFYECITSAIIHKNPLPAFENMQLNDSPVVPTPHDDILPVEDPPSEECDLTINLEEGTTDNSVIFSEDPKIRADKSNNGKHIKFEDKPVIIPQSRDYSKKVKNKVKKSPNVQPSPDLNSSKKSKPIMNDLNLFTIMLEHFPHLELSQEMMHVLWRRFSTQSARLKRALLDVETTNNVSQRKIDDLIRRQEMLMDCIKNDSDHLMKMKALKSERNKELQIRSVILNRRIGRARAYRYYNDMSVVNKSRMLSAQQQEEAIFRKNFNDCLNIQKDAVRDIIAHKKEKLKDVVTKRQDQLVTVKRLCREEITRLKEKSQNSENQENKINKELKLERDKVKREMIERIERDVREIQQSLWEDKSNLFYRSLDADEFKNRLEKAAKKHTVHCLNNF